MKLLIDAGNTRIKWALVENGTWVRSGAFPVAQARELSGQFPASLQITSVWASNVAGEPVASQLRGIVQSHSARSLHMVTAQPLQCSVRNGYANPAQLGSDRWAALIAAWHMVHGMCLVVNSGTATTIDALSAQGEFIGGLILPGIELMQRSLAEAAVQLGREPGRYADFPGNTADAMFSGAIQATCGAILRQRAQLGDEAVPVVLSGGAAPLLREHLALPLQVAEDLVLQGLWLIAQESGEE